MGEGRGRTPKSLQVHTHRHRHTLRGGLYPSAAPCSATPGDPPSPGPRPPYAAGPEAWGWSPQGGRRRVAGGWRGGTAWPRPSGWRSSRPRPLWVGTTVGLRGGVEPIRAVSLRPSSRHPRREPSVPQPAQPLPGLAQRRGRWGRLFSIPPARRAVGSERRAATLRLRRQVGGVMGRRPAHSLSLAA